MSRIVGNTPAAAPPSAPVTPLVCNLVLIVSNGVVNIAAVDPAMPPTAKVGTGEAVAPPAPARRCTVRINCSKTKNLIADCGMFRHSTAVHPLYSPNTPPSATIPRVACHAVIAPLTWHLCFTHSEGVYTNEVATLAHPPAMQCATHARSSGNIGISRDFTASYDAVYIAEMGAEEARLAERPLYSPKTPRSRSIRASTLARGLSRGAIRLYGHLERVHRVQHDADKCAGNGAGDGVCGGHATAAA